MSKISFSDPGYLMLLAVALPTVGACWYLGFRRHLSGRDKYGRRQLVDRFTRRLKLASQAFRLAAMLLVAALLVVAVAGPQLPAKPERVPDGSLQVVAAIDVTRSMGAEDYRASLPSTWKLKFFQARGTRLDEAKYLLESDIMPAIVGNQLALVTYQGGGFPASDLTSDFGYDSFILDNWIEIGDAPYGTNQDGIKISDIYAALQTSLNQFNQFGSKKAQKVIVLFSDGDNTASASDMTKIEQTLVKEQIKLVIIGLGGAAVPIPQYNSEGQFTNYYHYQSGVEPTTGIDQENLIALAQATHGTYIHVNPESGSQPHIDWPAQLAPLTKVVVEHKELYVYPLGLALTIIGLLALSGLAAGGERVRFRFKRGGGR